MLKHRPSPDSESGDYNIWGREQLAEGDLSKPQNLTDVERLD